VENKDGNESHVIQLIYKCVTKEKKMALIGIRELRQKTAEVLRRVQQEGQAYVITQQGRPVALLSPLDQEKIEAEILRSARQSVSDGWRVYHQLAEEIRKAWPVGLETQTLMDDIRR
jgi:prevent-host-death family protein